LRALELIDGDSLTVLLMEARRQRRSLRQVLLASGAITVYQMALIEAGNLDALMLGPVRVVDRLRSTPREVLYRVFDPRRSAEAVLRHLTEPECQDAVHPDEFRQRFARAMVAHANLATTFEVLEIAGRPAVLQEWLTGLPSTDWPPLSAAPGVWVRLLQQAASGLHAVHQAGLAHGHLQAGSILLTGEGVVKICGLGEPGWLQVPPRADSTEDPLTDLKTLGQIALIWCSGSGRGKAKLLPEPLAGVLKRLEPEAAAPYASAAELLDALEQTSAAVPPNAEAWDRLVRHARDHATPHAALRQSA
jgi:serine/threonine protein kinase